VLGDGLMILLPSIGLDLLKLLDAHFDESDLAVYGLGLVRLAPDGGDETSDIG
jgi:hypothetical protein